jgi:hypothetical protein
VALSDLLHQRSSSASMYRPVDARSSRTEVADGSLDPPAPLMSAHHLEQTFAPSAFRNGTQGLISGVGLISAPDPLRTFSGVGKAS